MFKILLFCNRIIFQKNKNLYILFILTSLFNALFSVFGIASILPLLMVLINPETLINNIYFINYFPKIYSTTEELIYILSIVFLFIIITSIVANFLTLLLLNYLSQKTTYSLRVDFYSKLFEKDLSFFANIDRGDVIQIAGGEIEKIGKYCSNFLNLISKLFSLIFLFILLIILQPEFFYGFVIVVIFYLIIYGLIKPILKRYSLEFSKNARKFSKIAISFNFAFKEIKLFNLKKLFFFNYKNLGKKQVVYNIKNLTLIFIPRYIFEIFLFLGAIFFINYGDKSLFEISNISKLGVIVLGIWRITPIIFDLYKSFSEINYNTSASYHLKRIFKDFFNQKKNKNKKNLKKKFKFERKINIDVQFNYKNSNKIFIFNHLIKKKDRVLVTGPSGSGKSTFLNLLSGLTKPTKGNILIDDNSVYDNLESYTSNIGFVTQNTFLFDGSLQRNIVFKEQLSEEEDNLLRNVYNICGLKNIVKKYEDLLTKKINLDSPELSGGQKQRMSLARVLFRKPKLLIMDESLNALDLTSEKKIMSKIIQLFPNMTIVSSSHRPIKKFFNKKIKIEN